MEKEYKMSAARAKELQEELNFLKTTRSDEVAEQIKIARGFGDLSENSEYDEAKNEQGKLYSRIAELEENARSVDSLERENKRLKDLQGLTQARQDFQLMDSYVIGSSSVDWTSTLTIDRGSIDGVEVGMCAVTSNGEVVGLITEVGSNYSIVKTVLDSSLEISGTIASSGYNGIVTGAYITGQEGMLRMDYLPSSAIIRNRDQVVTSGSTVYPRDLILGYVVDAGYEETGVAKFALLEPAVELGSLEQIFVLMAFDTDSE